MSHGESSAPANDYDSNNSYAPANDDDANKQLLNSDGKPVTNSGRKSLSLVVHQSVLRAVTYTLLFLTILSGIVLTWRYNISEDQGGGWTPDSKWPRVDLKNNRIFNIYGYNNVCVYFDELPAKYVSAWLLELTLVVFAMYAVVSHVCTYLCYQRNLYTHLEVLLMRATVILDVISFTYAIEIFAVTPEESMTMHTVPFSCLVMGIAVAGIRNVVHDYRVINWSESKLPYARQLFVLYGVLLTISSVYKLNVQYRGIIKDSPPAPKWGQFSDNLWMVFAIYIPWLKALVTLFVPKVFPRQDQVMHVDVSYSPIDRDDLKCACCAARCETEPGKNA